MCSWRPSFCLGQWVGFLFHITLLGSPSFILCCPSATMLVWWVTVCLSACLPLKLNNFTLSKTFIILILAFTFALNVSFSRGIGSSKVTVLGYGLLTTDARALIEALNRQHFAVVVVDESHYLKSRNAARTKILVPLIHSAKRAILLTGTPALGRPEEVIC